MKKLLVRLLLGTLLSAIICGLLYFLIVRYDKSNSIMNRLLENNIYIIYIFVSTILIYIFLSYDGKLAKMLFYIIIAAHAVVFGRLLILPLFINGLSIYSQAPDLEGFVATKTSEIIVNKELGSDMAVTLEIKQPSNPQNNKAKNLSGNIKYDLDLDYENVISYSTQNSDDTSAVIITLPDGSLVGLLPQTSISIKKVSNLSGDSVEYIINQGKIFVYSPQESYKQNKNYIKNDNSQIFMKEGIISKSGNNLYQLVNKSSRKISSGEDIQSFSSGQYFEIKGNNVKISDTSYGLSLNPKTNTQIEDIKNNYDKELSEYLTKQIGGKTLLMPVTDKIVKNMLNMLFSINPDKYSKNLMNYYDFKKYLIPEISEKKSFENENSNNATDSIKSRFKEGTNSTKLYDYYISIKSFFDNLFKKPEPKF